MSATLILCVDGGGTRSRGRLADAAGVIRAEAFAGPLNPATDLTRALASLGELWASCAGATGCTLAEATLAIGAAGLYLPAVQAAFRAGCPDYAGVVALSDGYAALIGAGRGQPSALIVAGTGVAGHRLYVDGRSIQRDAWGWVAGDRGSGAWIGRAGLRHCFAALDGIVPWDGLSEAILHAIGGRATVADGWVANLTPDRLGALAPVVLDRAAAADTAAITIRGRAVEHLAALAGVLDAGDVPLFAVGGIAEALLPLLAGALGRPVHPPEADALTGCWLVATGRAPPERVTLFATEDRS